MRKPWNMPSYPVYSLITLDSMSKKNMNIMTYVIPVSMKPKHYIIALYENTQSLSNWNHTHRGILQILGPENTLNVRVLGKKSGKTYDKMKYLAKKGLLTEDGHIRGLAGYIELEEISELPSLDGDHRLFLCRVVSSKSYHEEVLSTDRLTQDNIIL